MSNIVFHSRSGADSKLHLEVPVGQPNTEFEVEVMVRPKNPAPSFPPGYFNLIGSVDDETLIIHPQPPLPPPVEIAAIALANRCTLVTHNTSEFGRVPGLTLQDWLQP